MKWIVFKPYGKGGLKEDCAVSNGLLSDDEIVEIYKKGPEPTWKPKQEPQDAARADHDDECGTHAGFDCSCEAAQQQAHHND